MFEALKRSFGLVAALSFGYLVFKEPISRAKVVTLVAIGIGIAILLT
jgi:multidrug transporter EmrE-like cation transporter